MKESMKQRIIRCGVIFLITVTLLLVYGWLEEWKQDAFEAVNMVSERILVPGGQSVGIRKDVRGVLVVGLEEIETSQGIVSPGYLAGLQIGDMIQTINGTPVYYASDVERIVNETREALDIGVLRKKDELHFQVQPVQVLNEEEYKIGVWVKEKIAGIGTLSFYDPQSGMFAALGHGIYENQTGTLLEVGTGELLRTEVKSIQEGEAGKPGEIRGIFYNDETAIGSVTRNSQFGIYAEGIDFEEFQNAEPMIMATQEQIEEGPAVIRTTIRGGTVETFDIYIDKIHRQKSPGSKGIELTVTDERLLSCCGGIVQGMSGSPIIQKGRIIGAVTHVFNNNPTKGYGIFAEWMVDEGEKSHNLN